MLGYSNIALYIRCILKQRIMKLEDLNTSQRATLRFAVGMTSLNGLIKTIDEVTEWLSQSLEKEITRSEATSLLAETEKELKLENTNNK